MLKIVLERLPFILSQREMDDGKGGKNDSGPVKNECSGIDKPVQVQQVVRECHFGRYNTDQQATQAVPGDIQPEG